MTDSTDDFHYTGEQPLTALEDDCKLLGGILDECLKLEVGEALFEKVERIRLLAHCASTLAQVNETDSSALVFKRIADELMAMPLEEALPLARAFGHYMNLTSIAELHHRVRSSRKETKNPKSCQEVLSGLVAEGVDPEELYRKVVEQTVEIVLTAHPTQINRRTLQYKHTRIATLLQQNDRPELTPEERDTCLTDLVREVHALWQTDELRRQKPTVQDEARGGLHIVEQSLWAAVPLFIRKLGSALKKATGRDLPLNATPFRFASWMGGDRDGNPHVTAAVTEHVSALGRWMAADLYLREVDALRFEMSMNQCSQEVWVLCKAILRKARIAGAEAPDGAAPDQGGVMGKSKSRGVRDGIYKQTVASKYPEGMVIGTNPSTDGQTLVTDVPHELPGEGVRGTSECDYDEDDPGTELSEPSLDAIGGLATVDEVSTPTSTGPMASGFASQTLRSAMEALHMLQPGAEKLVAPGPLRVMLSSALSVGQVPSSSIPTQLLTSPANDPSAARRLFMRSKLAADSSVFKTVHEHPGMHPYRIILGEVRRRLQNTRRRAEAILAGNDYEDTPGDYYETEEELAAPLVACYWSLWECGGGVIADGRLLDLIRRVYVFGMALMKLDLRQESTRHEEVLDAVTTYLGMGSYSAWSEEERLEFLTKELTGRRPLVPPEMPMSEPIAEALATFKTAAKLGPGNLGAYVISMCRSASDVLAVEVLQREAVSKYAADSGSHSTRLLRVVPLFETLDDLDASPAVLNTLFNNPWYRKHLAECHGNHQEVMLGYSDSGKDAGRLAANWALYRCQAALVSLCKAAGVKLTLFHGRGGTIGRGGGPTYMAIQSQAPGSVEGSFRITEQGEMVQTKFGIPQVAVSQLEIYTTAVLRATMKPPPPPTNPEWLKVMDLLGDISCTAYREIVVNHPSFIAYFRHATPEAELGNLNIGSRPARRREGGGISTLRAIPWIFAWTQTRLILSSWLGVGEALRKVIDDQGQLPVLRDMYRGWPFFEATVDLIEMILAKCDMRIAELYDSVLVEDPEEKALGVELRRRFKTAERCILAVTGHKALVDNNPTLRRLIGMRNPYIDPINILQVEVLRRLRLDPDNVRLRDALLVTINGIAAGMRNTG